MNIVKCIESMKVLTEMGANFLHRIYLMKGKLLTNEKSNYLHDTSISKLRHKLEKKYPNKPDFQKLPGVDIFVEKSSNIKDEFEEFNQLLLDVSEFTTATKECLKEITSSILEFTMRKNRNLIIIFFDLLTNYIKVMIMLESIEDLKLMAAMYSAAEHFVNPQSIPTYLEGTGPLVLECENLLKHFIDYFTPMKPFLEPLLQQLKDSVKFGNQDVADLRSKCILNPMNEGENISLPCNQMLYAATPVSIYTELMQLEQYHEYIIYSMVACPALLFEEFALDLLRIITSVRLVVGLFRDMKLNIHTELEKISLVFPGASTSTMLSIPKGFKLKSVLKEISRHSVAQCAKNQSIRRSYLTSELSILNNIIRLIPGLIAPKLPMILAASSLAKAEVIAYFRHVEIIPARKDSKMYYNNSDYTAHDVVYLMQELTTMMSHLQKQYPLIQSYYVEYLVECDLNRIRRFCTSCAQSFTLLEPFFLSFVSDIETLKQNSSEFDGFAFRLNWDRVMAMATSQTMMFLTKQSSTFEALCEIMHGVYERTSYISKNSSKDIISKHCDYYEIWWLRSTFMTAYTASYNDPNSYSAYCFLYFQPLQSVGNNYNEECQDEVPILNQIAKSTANKMLDNLCSYLLTLIKYLWEHFGALENQYHPLQAGKKMERNLQIKHTTGIPMIDSLPGVESEPQYKKSIEKLELIQRNISLIITAAREKQPFYINDEEYNPMKYLKQQIIKYFERRLHGLFFNGDRMNRSSTVMNKMMSGCHTFQFVVSYLDNDFTSILRDVLFREIHDPLINPPGTPIPINVLPASSKILIHKISVWFSDLIQHIVTTGSGLVWVPSQYVFINAIQKNFVQGSNSSSSTQYENENHLVRMDSETAEDSSINTGVTSTFSKKLPSASSVVVDLFLDRSELKQLVTLVGIQGVRTIDSQLLTLICNQLEVILKFLKDHRDQLVTFEKTYHSSLTYVMGMKGLDTVYDALKIIGVILTIRESLHTALGQVTDLRCNSMKHVIESLFETIDPWPDHLFGTPVSCLASDVGVDSNHFIHHGIDLSLTASIFKYNFTLEEIETLSLFPTVAAVLFLSEKWNKSIYIPELEAFDNNEHCMQYAISKLMLSFFCITNSYNRIQDLHHQEGKSSSETSADRGTTEFKSSSLQDIHFLVTSKSSVVQQLYLDQWIDKYFRISSQILLVSRQSELQGSSHPPFRAMCLMLEYFIRLHRSTYSTLGYAGVLEKYLPNCLIHAGLVDISLGKLKFSDTLGSFTHVTTSTNGIRK